VRRGIAGAAFETPALDHYVAHFDLFLAHASRYLRLYYGSDGDPGLTSTWAFSR